MNKQLQGSLIQRPNEAPAITPPPRKETFWTSDKKEHFGEVTKEEAEQAANEAGQAAKSLATSDEAQAAGKGFLNIVLEILKILYSSAAGIALFSGVLLLLEKRVMTGKMEIESLFKMSTAVFVASLVVALSGFLIAQVMAIKDQAVVIAEDENVQAGLAQAKTTASDAAADAEMEAAIASSMASDTVNEASSNVPDSVKEGVADASSIAEDSGITST